MPFGRLVTQSSLDDLAHQATPGVWVRTPQAEVLRDALVAQGTSAEMQTADTVLALETITESVGVTAAGAGVVIYEMTSQHFVNQILPSEPTATPVGLLPGCGHDERWDTTAVFLIFAVPSKVHLSRSASIRRLAVLASDTFVSEPLSSAQVIRRDPSPPAAHRIARTPTSTGGSGPR